MPGQGGSTFGRREQGGAEREEIGGLRRADAQRIRDKRRAPAGSMFRRTARQDDRDAEVDDATRRHRRVNIARLDVAVHHTGLVDSLNRRPPETMPATGHR